MASAFPAACAGWFICLTEERKRRGNLYVIDLLRVEIASLRSQRRQIKFFNGLLLIMALLAEVPYASGACGERAVDIYHTGPVDKHKVGVVESDVGGVIGIAASVRVMA